MSKKAVTKTFRSASKSVNVQSLPKGPIKGKSANILIVDDPHKPKEIDPFGKLHDYASVSGTGNPETPFVFSDGTHRIEFLEFTIAPSCNWSKPYSFKTTGSEIMLTQKQLEKVFADFLRLTANKCECKDDEEDPELKA